MTNAFINVFLSLLEHLLHLYMSVSLEVSVHAAGIAGVGEGIRQLSLGAGADAGQRGRDSQRRGVLRYMGLDTRPPHVTNKQGHVRVVIRLMLLLIWCRDVLTTRPLGKRHLGDRRSLLVDCLWPSHT